MHLSTAESFLQPWDGLLGLGWHHLARWCRSWLSFFKAVWSLWDFGPVPCETCKVTQKLVTDTDKMT